MSQDTLKNSLIPVAGYDLLLPFTSRQTLDQPIEIAARQVFKEISVLDQELTIFIPSQDRHAQPVDHEFIARVIQKTFRRLFGGFTFVKGKGSSEELSEDAAEEISIISAFTTENLLKEHWLEVLSLVRSLFVLCDQGSVAIQVNGALLLLK